MNHNHTPGVAAPSAGYALVPLDAPESLRGQLCGYGADLGYMEPRDRAVILQRGAERWAEILRWAGACGVTVPIPHTFAPPDADTGDSMEGGKNG